MLSSTGDIYCGFCKGLIQNGQTYTFSKTFGRIHSFCDSILGPPITSTFSPSLTCYIPNLESDTQEKPKRKSWKIHLAELAIKTSEMATCTRLKVGTVIVKEEKYPISYGINGSVCGDEHCIDVGCLIENNHCIKCVHSESNALVTAAKFGISVYGCSMFISHFPCFSCFKMIVNSGINQIYYINDYKNDQKVYDLVSKLNLHIEQINLDEHV